MSQNQIRRDLPGAATPGSSEATRIRSYLQTQAAKLSLPDLSTKVRTDMEQFKASLFAAPADKLTQRPSESDWSVNEVAAHLLQVSESVSRAIQSVLDSGALPPSIADQMRRTDEVKTAREWWSLLLTDREVTIERVSRATGDEHLDVKWDHGVFGELNWREWLLFMRVHDLDHARQILSVSEAVSA
ncbi:MAG TPA: DinB family protein [Dehalococcoidia bacterium]|jgi:uncharacterized damage-inducible protein DinB|nr:DinB family protein [Dehalococcoidia bacterium]